MFGLLYCAKLEAAHGGAVDFSSHTGDIGREISCVKLIQRVGHLRPRQPQDWIVVAIGGNAGETVVLLDRVP